MDKIRNLSIKGKIIAGFVISDILFAVLTVLLVVMQVTSGGKYITEYRNLAEEVAQNSDGAFEAAIDYGYGRIDSIQRNTKVTVAIAIIFFLIILASIIILTRVISSSLYKPAANMREAANKLSQGDVEVDIIHFYNDELGELSDDLKKMAENIKVQAEVAKQISEGNLDIEMKAHSEKDLLGGAIVNMLSAENSAMTKLRDAATQIGSGASEIAAASQSLAQGSTEQASAIQEITASIDDITERTRVNADDANNANNLVVSAKENATNGNGKMHEMIDAMNDINRSSENISKIIKVIDDIAFQTNILALNAAVEAARAGQHGRGFAVVAEEVRNLAGKSAQAASETADMIADSISKVEKGTKLAEETAEALEKIVGFIDRIVTITNSIAVASNDQANAISQINTAIGQVSQVVQTNSAMSEECAAASEQLSSQASKLNDIIARYKLKDSPQENSFKGTKTLTNAMPAAAASGSFAVPHPNRKNWNLPADKPMNSIDKIELPDDNPPITISLDDGYGKY